jgi:hypothetical protein
LPAGGNRRRLNQRRIEEDLDRLVAALAREAERTPACAYPEESLKQAGATDNH